MLKNTCDCSESTEHINKTRKYAQPEFFFYFHHRGFKSSSSLSQVAEGLSCARGQQLVTGRLPVQSPAPLFGREREKKALIITTFSCVPVHWSSTEVCTPVLDSSQVGLCVTAPACVCVCVKLGVPEKCTHAQQTFPV